MYRRAVCPIISLLILLCVTADPMAHAEWYLGGDLGVVIPHGLSNQEGTGSALGLPAAGTKFNDFSMSPGFVIGGKAGYFFESVPWFGLEADLQGSWPQVKEQAINGRGPSLIVTGSTTKGSMRVLNAGLNVLARYPGERLQPYIGVGPALVHIDAFEDGTASTELGVNVLAGLRYFVRPEVGLFAEYKYLQTSYTSDHALTSTLGIKGDYSASHLVFGVSYHFGRKGRTEP